MPVNQASLYIHIPFCASLCDYCDFYSVIYKENDYIDLFLQALVNDIKYQIEFFKIKEIPTVYIGGGTPSVLGSKLKILLDVLNDLPDFSPVEFSVEANPESITEEFLLLCRESNVNRISLGVQTFNELSRHAVSRTGNIVNIKKNITLASHYFSDSLSVDLITGLPYQDVKSVLEDIKIILDFNPAHVSLYSLIPEINTPLNKKITSKKIILPDEDTADTLWLSGRDALLKAGLLHYEVSNFAFKDKFCVHNIGYWQMKNWIGAGPSASGTLESLPNTCTNDKSYCAKRFTYSSDVDVYINNPSIHVADYEELDKCKYLRECLLMGFRFINGPDTISFKKCFGVTLEECIPDTLEYWKNKDRMLYLNRFLTDAFLELDKIVD